MAEIADHLPPQTNGFHSQEARLQPSQRSKLPDQSSRSNSAELQKVATEAKAAKESALEQTAPKQTEVEKLEPETEAKMTEATNQEASETKIEQARRETLKSEVDRFYQALNSIDPKRAATKEEMEYLSSLIPFRPRVERDSSPEDSYSEESGWFPDYEEDGTIGMTYFGTRQFEDEEYLREQAEQNKALDEGKWVWKPKKDL